jgi:hypothetical protein
MDEFIQILKNCKKSANYEIQLVKWIEELEPMVTCYVMQAYLMLIDFQNINKQIRITGTGEEMNIYICVFEYLKLIFGANIL